MCTVRAGCGRCAGREKYTAYTVLVNGVRFYYREVWQCTVTGKNVVSEVIRLLKLLASKTIFRRMCKARCHPTTALADRKSNGLSRLGIADNFQ